MTVSHRPILDYLRDDYGVHDAVVVAGGKHPRAEFTYRDKRFKVTLPYSPSDANWVVVKKGDIRRQLGAPLNQVPEKERRSLDDMTLELNGNAETGPPAPASSSFVVPNQPGRLAYNKGRLTLVIEPHAFRAFNHAGPLKVVRREGDRWEAVPSADDRNPRFRYHKQSRGWVFDGAVHSQVMRGFEEFGRSPVTLTVTPRSISIAIERGNLKARRLRGTERVFTQMEAPSSEAPVEVAAKPTPDGPRLGYTQAQIEADCRNALVAIRRLESLSLYRLTRVKTDTDTGYRWEWRVPAITLEE